MCLMRAVFVRILERYGQFRGTSRLLGTDGPFPGKVSLIRGMSGLCQGVGGVPGTGALIPGMPYLA